MKTDNQLLAEYMAQGSEAAFRELVERHIDLVHSAALRESRGDGSVAEDITQAVFTEMARCATKLVSHPAIAGWLYTCVRRMTANVLRAEQRRKDREQKAFAMNELLRTEPPDQLWQQIRPVLDDAMHELDQEDRTAVVLRFFEERSLKEVGAALGLTENAARMRVERSLEKLHSLLSRRGINSSASTLAAVLVAGAALKAPSSLASSVATAAITAAPAVDVSSTLTAARLLPMTRTNAVVAGASVVLVAAILVLNHLHSSHGKRIVQPESAAPPTIANVIGQPTQSGSTDSVVATTNAVAASVMALRLLEAETGDPLPGAKLHLFYLLDDGRGKTVKAVTDSNGRLEVEKPKAPYRALNMFVAAEGHVPKVTSWDLGRHMPSEYTMKLERGATIGGVVVDQTSQPVAGAKIEFDNPGNDMSLAENIQFGPDTPATTENNGHWSCNMIPERFEHLSLTITHPDFAETNITVQPNSTGATNLLITMLPGFFVRGLVQDVSGNSIEGATVRQVRWNEENEHSKTTDGSGAFEFKSMASGELMLAVQAKGFAPAVQTLQVTNNIDALQFQLGPGQLLRGLITDEQGNPVGNAFIETTRRAVHKIRWSTNADANGRFEWDSAPQEPLLYSVLAEGFNRAYSQTLQADGSEHQIKLTHFQPDMDNIQVTGTAVDADSGLPLNTFKVFMSELDPDWAFPLQFCTEAGDGKFNVSFKEKSNHPGYRIQIVKDGYFPAVSADLLRKAGNLTLEFQLHKGAGPSGIVLLPSGEPASNAEVLLCTSLAGVRIDGPAHVEKGLNTTTYQTHTDADGVSAHQN
jgi:RNA polymerase sigma factor (sigma-70 family)